MADIMQQMMLDAGNVKQAASIMDTMQADAQVAPAVPVVANAPTSKPAPKSWLVRTFDSTVSALNDAVPSAGAGDFIPSALHHAGNLVHGGAQFIENSVAKAADYVAPGSSVAKAINRVAQQDNQAMQQREQQYKPMGDSNTPGAWAGAATGELLPFAMSGGLTSGISKAGNAVASPITKIAENSPPIAQKIAALLGKSASGATQGGLISLASPVNDGGDYWANKGDQVKTGLEFGATVPVVGATLNAGYTGAKNLLSPIFNPKGTVAEALKGWTGGNGMQNPAELVPGSLPTTAQVSGSPELVQAEKAAANNPDLKAQFVQREIDNNAARLAAVQSVAKTPQELAAAITARKNVTTPLYTQAQDSSASVDPTRVVKLIDRLTDKYPSNGPLNKSLGNIRDSLFESYPDTQKGADAWKVLDSAIGSRMSSADADALRQARTLAYRVKAGTIAPQDAMESMNGLSATSKTASDALDLAMQHFKAEDNVLRQSPAHIMSAMDNVKSLLSDVDNKFVSKQLLTVKNALAHQLNKAEPSYGQAERTFAEMSKPINTMETGQALLDTLSNKSLNAAGDPNIAFTNYTNQLAKALKNADYGIDPQAQATLENVGKDLQRATISNSIKSPGSDTAFNVQAPGWLGKHLYGENFSGPTGTGKIIGALLGGGVTGHPILGAGVGYGMAEKAGKFVGSRVNKELVKALLNPDYAAALQAGNAPVSGVLSSPLLLELQKKAPQIGASLFSRQPVPAR